MMVIRFYGYPQIRPYHHSVRMDLKIRRRGESNTCVALDMRSMTLLGLQMHPILSLEALITLHVSITLLMVRLLRAAIGLLSNSSGQARWFAK